MKWENSLTDPRKLTFIRITDLKTLCTESFSKVRESGHVPKESVGISLLVCGDKGGSSTKILCQFTNSQASHSVKQPNY